MAHAEVMDRTTGEIMVMPERPVQTFDSAQIELIKRTIAKDCTNDEFALFLHQCKRTQLDPLTRQIYCLKRQQWDAREGRNIDVLSIQTSIDGFRLIAERTGRYAGQLGPYWCGPDGQWQDVWIDGQHAPAAAKVGVLRSDFKEPLFGVARFDAYAARKKGGDLNAMWSKMGDLMIAKCAEALALRRAFPQELSGLYTSDEMQQADTGTDSVTAAPQKDPRFDSSPPTNASEPVSRGRQTAGSANPVQAPPPATNGAQRPLNGASADPAGSGQAATSTGASPGPSSSGDAAARETGIAQWRNAAKAIDACDTIPEIEALFADEHGNETKRWFECKAIITKGDPAKAAGAIQQLVDRAEARKGLLMGGDLKEYEV